MKEQLVVIKILNSVTNSDVRDKSVKKRQGWLSLTILLASLTFAQYIYSKTNTYQVLISLDVNTYLKH